MAQTLSGINIRSSLSATMAGQGTNVLNEIRIGRTLSTNPAAADADIIYSVKFSSTAPGDVVTWDLDLHKFTANASDTTTALDRTGHTFSGYAPNDGTPGTPTDAVGDTIPTATKIVAMMYETDSTNTGNITCVATDVKFGNITLGFGDSLVRSALLMPRESPTGVDVVLTFTANADDLTVVVLAKS